MNYYTKRDEKIFYLFWGLGLIFLLMTWFGTALDIKLFSATPFEIVFVPGTAKQIHQVLDIGTTFKIKMFFFFVYFFLQIIALVAAFFVPKKDKKSHDTLTLILSAVLIAYMILLLIVVKLDVKEAGIEFMEGLLTPLYASLRKSIYLALALIAGLYVSRMEKAIGFVDSLGGKAGPVKNMKPLENSIQVGKNALNLMTAKKVTTLKDKVRQAKIELGKEAYRLNLTVLDEGKELFPQISKWEHDIKRKETDLLTAENKKVCPQCHNVIPLESMFCTECGTKQESHPQPTHLPPEEIRRTISRLQFEVDKCYKQLGQAASDKEESMPEALQSYFDVLKNNEFELREREEEQLRESGMKRCKNCGKTVDKHVKFCDACGEKIATDTTCPECGTENQENASFCNNCGHKLH